MSYLASPNLYSAATPEHQRRYRKVEAVLAKLPLKPSDERAFWRDESGRIFVNIRDSILSSRFLPLLNTQTGTVQGHVAELIDVNGRSAQLDLTTLDDNAFVATDRLLRALHTLNYFGGSNHAVRLFLDVNHRFLSSVSNNHGQAFRELIFSLDLATDDFVIQVVSSDEADLGTLTFAADNYRRNGFQIGLHSRNLSACAALIEQIRPGFLSLWTSKGYPFGELAPIVAAASAHQVQLLARGLSDTSLAPALREAGIQLYQPETFQS